MGAGAKKRFDQSKQFIEAARELGCDDDPATFDKVLKKIASAPPPKRKIGKRSYRRTLVTA